MFLYQLAVLESHQNRGIGRALCRPWPNWPASAAVYGMWVLTEHDNVAALKAYGAAGGEPDGRPVMLSWNLAD